MRDFNYVLSLARGFARPVTGIRQTPGTRVFKAERHAPGPSPRSRPPVRSVR
jgi:hypothetical protein